MRVALVAACLVLLDCQNDVQSQDNGCYPLFAVGPDAACPLEDVCLPSTVATCASNSCCHEWCFYDGTCGSAACLTLTPEQLGDAGVDGCECTDAGPCICADGGPCYRDTCLAVCANSS